MLKVGVFGVGHLGRIHVQQWLEIPGTELVGFYDPNDDNAAKIITEFHIKRYDQPEALIRDVQAVDVVTTTTSHYEMASLCLKHGKHLFIEKPLAHTLTEAQSLVKMVAEANVKCQIGHVERYNPALKALVGHTIAPMFVEAHRLSQFNPRGTDVAVVLDLMIHDIDVLLHFVKSPVKRVSASGVSVISETTDIANAHLVFDNGCVANLTASRISLKKMRKMRFFQRDAYIGIDFLKKKSEIIRLKSDQEERGFFDFPIETAQGEQKMISVEIPPVQATNAIREELADFTLSVLTGKEVKVPATDGLNAMEVAHQILEKIETQSLNKPLL